MAAVVAAAPERAAAGGVLALSYEDADFTGPLVIDNPYWPLNPDVSERTFTYLAESEDGCVKEEATVFGAGPYKVLAGAAPYTGDLAVVVEDIGYVGEDCTGDFVKTEHTFAWYRQDDSWNIWYVGELRAPRSSTGKPRLRRGFLPWTGPGGERAARSGRCDCLQNRDQDREGLRTNRAWSSVLRPSNWPAGR